MEAPPVSHCANLWLPQGETQNYCRECGGYLVGIHRHLVRHRCARQGRRQHTSIPATRSASHRWQFCTYIGLLEVTYIASLLQLIEQSLRARLQCWSFTQLRRRWLSPGMQCLGRSSQQSSELPCPGYSSSAATSRRSDGPGGPWRARRRLQSWP